jgi:glycine/D-amino acid oxidase-like deaminating enzyme
VTGDPLRWIDENRSVWTLGKPLPPPSEPLLGEEHADVCIIGGGFTGVSAALHIARRHPEQRVVLLEARRLANGASGRNGGMVLHWVNGVDARDPELARRLWTTTKEGIDLIEEEARHWAPGSFVRDGCAEVLTDPGRAARALSMARNLAAAGVPVEFLDRGALRQRIEIEGAEGALWDGTTGRLDGVAYLRGLAGALREAGVRVAEESPVLRIERGAPHRVVTTQGSVRAPVVVLATNAYSPQIGFFATGLVPLHSHVVATAPCDRWSALGWHAAAGFSDDKDRIAYGTLTSDGRLVFGGGSNAAYGYRWGSGTSWTGGTERSSAAICSLLHRYLPGTAALPIEAAWTGTVALTLSRVCTVGSLPDGVLYAVGFSGHGITLANLAGRVLSDLYAGTTDRWVGLPFFQQRLLPIPGEPFRWLGYHGWTSITGRSPRRQLS